MRVREGQRERDTESEAGSRLWAVSCQRGARTRKPWDHDLSQSWMLIQLSHPGAPESCSFQFVLLRWAAKPSCVLEMHSVGPYHLTYWTRDLGSVLAISSLAVTLKLYWVSESSKILLKIEMTRSHPLNFSFSKSEAGPANVLTSSQVILMLLVWGRYFENCISQRISTIRTETTREDHVTGVQWLLGFCRRVCPVGRRQ